MHVHTRVHNQVLQKKILHMLCYLLCVYVLRFVVYLFILKGIEREVLYLLIHFPNEQNDQCWVRLKLGASSEST